MFFSLRHSVEDAGVVQI